MNKGFFITGTGTGVGKTFISSLLCEALGADYWKPVQCGNIDDSDAMYIKSSSIGKVRVIPEQYIFKAAESPHYASLKEGVRISISDFKLPVSDKLLIVEGAGGIMVPINEDENITDLAVHLKLPVILVAGYYLGAINHTMLSLEYLTRYNLSPVMTFFNNGWPTFASSVIKKRFPSLNFIDIIDFQYNSGTKKEAFHLLIQRELAGIIK